MRLFVAIDLPAFEKQRIATQLARAAEQRPLPVRWLAPETLHITLKFLGDVNDAMLPALESGLERAVAGVAAFDVDVHGFGAFPSSTRPSVFWVGVDAVPQLLALQRSVEQAVVPFGFQAEPRAYRPHITVGKVQARQRVADRQAVDRIRAGFEYKQTLRVEWTELMRSHPGPRGARYEILRRMKLH